MKAKSIKFKTECPECKEMFKGSVGRATHMRRSHGLNVDGTKWHPPTKSKAEKSKAIVVVKKRKVRLDNVEDQFPKELYAYIVSKLEDIIHRVAFEHDLPERQFAQGFSAYLQRPQVW